jgi:hypothetical protein
LGAGVQGRCQTAQRARHRRCRRAGRRTARSGAGHPVTQVRARNALRKRLDDEQLDQEIDGYAAAYAEWNEAEYDHLAGDGLDGGV